MSVIFLAVKYKDKDNAKQLGAKWDKHERLWFIPIDLDDESSEKLLNLFGEALPNKIYINVNYDDKNDAKSHAAQWDKKEHRWYIPRNCTEEECKYLKYRFHNI